MLIAAYQFLVGRTHKQGEGPLCLPLYVAVFGVWLFLMFWETNPRYFSNFAPVIIVCGVLGISQTGTAITKLTDGQKVQKSNDSGAKTSC